MKLLSLSHNSFLSQLSEMYLFRKKTIFFILVYRTVVDDNAFEFLSNAFWSLEEDKTR